MPRNGSGAYSIPTSFTPNTPISSSAVNANFTDVGSALTESLTADGQKNATAQIKFFSGSAGAPGISWASDTDSGLYRIAGDNIGISIGGTKIADISSSGFGITGALTLTTPLAVAQGGTGATSASAAATAIGLGTGDSPQLAAVNLSHATQNTLTGSGGDAFVEGNRLFRIGGTDVPIADGGTGASSASEARTNLGVSYASTAEMESGAATDRVVAPGTQDRHPGHPKAWGQVGGGSSPSIATAHGIAGVSRPGAGRLSITFSTNFSSASYATIATVGANNILAATVADGTKTVGSVELRSYNAAGVLTDPNEWNFMLFGDHA